MMGNQITGTAAREKLPARWRSNPFAWIAAVNIISTLIQLYFRLFVTTPYSEYTHRLVTYEHGLIRRALIGELYSFFVSRVALWVVDLESVLTIAVAVWLGWLLFRITVRVDGARRLAIACFVFGSPFLFKNFVANVGKFDVLGAEVAMATALLPLRWWTYGLTFVLSALLLLTHHINATLFVPTIYGILLIRARSANRHSLATDLMIVFGSLALLACLFLFLVEYATPALSKADFVAYMHSRATIPFRNDLADMWYSTFPEEIVKTRAMLPAQIIRSPSFLFLIAIHWPIIQFGRRRLAAVHMADRDARRLWLAVLAVVVAAYLVTIIVAFDYARFSGDLAFCVALLAAVQLRTHGGPIRDAADLRIDSPWVILCATLVAAVPSAGTVTPPCFF